MSEWRYQLLWLTVACDDIIKILIVKYLRSNTWYQSSNSHAHIDSDASAQNKKTANNNNYHYHYNHFMTLWILTGKTRVRWYQKKHSPTHTYHGHQSSLICFLHLLRSMASLFNLRAWQCFCTISVQIFFGLPLGLAPSISYPIHFFTQSLSSFCNTCQYYHNLFCCSTEIMSSNPCLSLKPLLGTSFSLTPHIHLTILISACGSATTFFFLMGQVSLPRSILLCTQLLYSLLLTINDTSSLVSSDTKCLYLFHPIRILVSTAASASPSTGCGKIK